MSHWTYSTDDDEFYDAEFDSKQEADNAAQEAFCQECENEERRGHHSAQVNLVEFEWNDDTGERRIIQSVRSVVEWTYEKSDREEHFNQRDYL